MWVIGTEKRERLGAIVVRVGVLGAVGREVVKLSSKSTEDAARVKYAKLLVVLGLARGKNIAGATLWELQGFRYILSCVYWTAGALSRQGITKRHWRSLGRKITILRGCPQGLHENRRS